LPILLAIWHRMVLARLPKGGEADEQT